MFRDLGISDVHRQGTAVPRFFSRRKCATKLPWISGFWHLGQNEVSLENFCCTFCRETGLHGNFGVRINLGRHRTALQDFPSKQASKQASCTFVATKLRFVFTKVTCRMLPHRSDFIAVSPCEIRFGKPDNPVSIVWRNKRPNTSRSGWPWKKWNSSRKRQKNTKR